MRSDTRDRGEAVGQQRERQMKPTRHVTTVMLLAALAAVGCSKSDETSQAKSGAPDAAREARHEAGESLAAKGTGEEGFVAGRDADDHRPGVVRRRRGGVPREEVRRGDGDLRSATPSSVPTNAWGHYMLGLSAWKSGDFAKSEQAFDKALSIDPHHVKSLVNSSRVFIEQKRHDDAIARLTRAAEIDPGVARGEAAARPHLPRAGEDGRGRSRRIGARSS